MKFEKVHVSVYSGYMANERPASFRFSGRDYKVEKIIDRWYEGSTKSSAPPMNYFKVLADDGGEYILRYNGLFDVWSIMIYD
jgi:hypothetical protein